MKVNLFRKVISCLAVGAMLLTAMTGCSKEAQKSDGSPETAADTKKTAESEAEAGEQTAATGSEFKVALISVQSFGDNGPADDMKAAVNRAAEELGVKTATYEALQADQYEESLRNFAQNDYNMIITAFPGMVQPLSAVARDFPDIKFVHIYNSEDYGLNNVSSVDFATWEANYVCGVAAAMSADSNLIGHIVGAEDNTILANYNALLKGAQSVNPNAAVERVNAGTFDDPAKGKEIALSLYGKGAKVVIGDAGKTTLGMIEAAQESDAFIIGDASDHSAIAPGNVLMDTKIGFGNMVYAEIDKMVKGTFEPGITFASYANDGIGTFKNVTIGDNRKNGEDAEKLSALWKKIDEVEAQIKDGTLKIEKDISK